MARLGPDIEVDVQKGVLTHQEGDYEWMSESRVPTRELPTWYPRASISSAGAKPPIGQR
jgi:hypothetical protein